RSCWCTPPTTGPAATTPSAERSSTWCSTGCASSRKTAKACRCGARYSGQRTGLRFSVPCLQGFLLYHSVGGGTGSGFGALLLERLQWEYPKKTKLSLTVYPAPQVSTAIVEPFNALLATDALSDKTDVSFILDNEA